MQNNIIKKIGKEKLVTLIMLAVACLAIIILLCVFNTNISQAINKSFGASGVIKQIFNGLLNTFIITALAFLIGLVLGIVTCLIEGLKSKNIGIIILKNIFRAYVSIFRGTPMMVQLLIIYFIVFASYRGDAVYIAVLVFGLNSGAYVSEIIRGGINSIPAGQMEAGSSLGLPYRSVMTKIIFPQAIRNSLPSLGNEFITLLKDSSVAGFIGATELTLVFRTIANATYDYTTVYLIMGITYFVLVFIITKLFGILERKLLHAKNR
jgi:His/Glu/Gln/Arg/opine family amino acid ABC transporter permease subunit